MSQTYVYVVLRDLKLLNAFRLNEKDAEKSLDLICKTERRNMSKASREGCLCHTVCLRHTMWQWKSRVPGMSVMTLTTRHVPGATVIVSRRRGFVKLC